MVHTVSNIPAEPNYLFMSQEQLAEREAAARAERLAFLDSVRMPMSPEDSDMAHKLAMQELEAKADLLERQQIDKSVTSAVLDLPASERPKATPERELIAPWVAAAALQLEAMQELAEITGGIDDRRALHHYRQQDAYRQAVDELAHGYTVAPDK